jgi:hypothetical protein
MHSDPDRKKTKKTPYSPPFMSKLSLEQAKQFVSRRTNCSVQEATDFLESLRRAQPDKLRSRGAQNRIEELPVLRRG